MSRYKDIPGATPSAPCRGPLTVRAEGTPSGRLSNHRAGHTGGFVRTSLPEIVERRSDRCRARSRPVRPRTSGPTEIAAEIPDEATVLRRGGPFDLEVLPQERR